MVCEITIPKYFFDDHTMSLGLPAPPVLRETRTHYIIDAHHPDLQELVDNCALYCHRHGPERGPWKSAAYALRRSLRKQGVEVPE